MQSLARLSDVYLPNTSFIFMTKDDMYFHVKSKYIVLIWGLTRMLPVPVLKRKDSLLTTSSTKFVTGTPSSCRIRVYQTWKLKYQNTTVRCWRLVLQWNYFHHVSTETSTSFFPEEKTESKTSRRTGIPLSVSTPPAPFQSINFHSIIRNFMYHHVLVCLIVIPLKSGSPPRNNLYGKI